MIEEFTLNLREQREWGWLIVVAFFCGGVGAGAFLVSWLLGINSGLILGLLVVAVGTNGALLFDLGRAERFWRVFTRPATSWISRGAFLITAFLVFGALSVLPAFSWFSWLPWSSESGLGRGIGFVAVLLAFGVSIYSGFVMSYSPSIPFWNTSILPVLFASYALAGGTAAIVAVLPGAASAARAFTILETMVIVLLIASLVLLAVYLVTMFYSTLAAKEAARMLLQGPLAPAFLVGVVGLGLLVPLGIVVYQFYSSGGSQAYAPALAVAAALELLGGLLMRYCVIRAGTYGATV